MSIRTDRVARMIQREVADLLQNDFSAASDSLLTVTDTRITKDLGTAYVNVSVFGATPEARNAAFEQLEALTVPIRTALAQRIRHQVRRIPELKFFLDEGPQQAAKMDDVFAQIRADREERGVPHKAPPEEPEESRGDY